MAEPQRKPDGSDRVAERMEAVEEVIPRLEEQAQKLIREFSGVLSRGEDTVARARAWLDEHPVSKGMVENSLRRANFNRMLDELPERWEDFRHRASDSAKRLRSDFMPEVKNRVTSLKKRPLDAALLGVAAALVAAVAIRARD